MNQSQNNQASSIPRWQSSKMKKLLTERWQEVWQEVETRVKNNGDLLSAQEGR